MLGLKGNPCSNHATGPSTQQQHCRPARAKEHNQPPHCLKALQQTARKPALPLSTQQLLSPTPAQQPVQPSHSAVHKALGARQCQSDDAENHWCPVPSRHDAIPAAAAPAASPESVRKHRTRPQRRPQWQDVSIDLTARQAAEAECDSSTPVTHIDNSPSSAALSPHLTGVSPASPSASHHFHAQNGQQQQANHEQGASSSGHAAALSREQSFVPQQLDEQQHLQQQHRQHRQHSQQQQRSELQHHGLWHESLQDQRHHDRHQQDLHQRPQGRQQQQQPSKVQGLLQQQQNQQHQHQQEPDQHQQDHQQHHQQQYPHLKQDSAGHRHQHTENLSWGHVSQASANAGPHADPHCLPPLHHRTSFANIPQQQPAEPAQPSEEPRLGGQVPVQYMRHPLGSAAPGGLHKLHRLLRPVRRSQSIHNMQLPPMGSQPSVPSLDHLAQYLPHDRSDGVPQADRLQARLPPLPPTASHMQSRRYTHDGAEADSCQHPQELRHHTGVLQPLRQSDWEPPESTPTLLVLQSAVNTQQTHVPQQDPFAAAGDLQNVNLRLQQVGRLYLVKTNLFHSSLLGCVCAAVHCSQSKVVQVRVL